MSLPVIPLVDGVYQLSAVSIFLHGEANAHVRNVSSPGQRTASALAEFGSTLQWAGISGVRAFNADGEDLDLPTGFQWDLIGQQSGFNHWNEAPKLPVPEPGQWALLAVGLAMLAVRRHTVVTGVEVLRDDTLTGQMPGRLIHG
mgnify:CR=1 FL=1